LGKPKAAFIAFATLSATVCFYGIQTLTIGSVARADAHRVLAPYTLRQDAYDFDDRTTGDLQGKIRRARRSDGATVDVQNDGPLAAGIYLRTVSLPDGTQVDLAQFCECKTTWFPTPQRRMLRNSWELHPPASNCVYRVELLVAGGQTLPGQTVDMVAWDSGGGKRQTTWRDPALDCVNLQIRIDSKQADGTFRPHTFVKLVSIQLGEPDARLFQDQAYYSEVPPSKMQAKIASALGMTLSPTRRQAEAELDRQYERGLVVNHQ
jgi:hypothetical protein